MTDQQVLIWSNHHKCWWRADGHGYCGHVADAGRYQPADTGQWLTRGCGCCLVPEVVVPAPTVDVLTSPDRLADYARYAPRAATREAVRQNRVNRYAPAALRQEARMKTEPLAAYSVAYDAFEGTPVADDEGLRPQMAQQVVLTLKDLRAAHGLSWLRRIGNGNTYFDEIRRASENHGHEASLLIGRVKLHQIYTLTAQTFIDAYGRKQQTDV